MSVSKETFLIVGCDIKDRLTDKFEDWYWSEEGEKWHCFATEGNLQIIDDGMCGEYIYLGYIIASIEDDYSSFYKEIDSRHLSDYALEVMHGLQELIDFGVLNREECEDIGIKTILFKHYR